MPPPYQFNYDPHAPLSLLGQDANSLASALQRAVGYEQQPVDASKVPQRPAPQVLGPAPTPLFNPLFNGSTGSAGSPLPPVQQSDPYSRFGPLRSAGLATFKALDAPGGAVRNVLAGEDATKGLNPFGSENSSSGRDVLRNWGAVSGPDTWTNAAAGFAAEMAMDPTNWFGGAMVKPLQKAAAGLSPRYAGGIEKLTGALGDANRNAATRLLDNEQWIKTGVGPAPTGPVEMQTNFDPFGGNALGNPFPTDTYDYIPDWKAQPEAGVVPGTERKFTRQAELDDFKNPYFEARQAAGDEVAARAGGAFPPNAIGDQNRLMEVFADNPAAFDRFMQELPPGSKRLGGGGAEGVAFLTPQGDVLRVGTGLIDREGLPRVASSAGYGLPESRLADPNIIQPTRNIPAGPVRIERVPYTPSIESQWPGGVMIPPQVTKPVGDLQKRLADRGVSWRDTHEGNWGYRTDPNTGARLTDQPQVLDPGLMKVAPGYNVPRAADSGTALTPWMQAAGLDRLYSPYVQELNSQAAARGLGAPNDWRQALRLNAADPLVRGLGAYNAARAAGSTGSSP